MEGPIRLGGAYRDGLAQETVRAPSRAGELVLALEPEHACLSIGDRLRLVVAGRFLTLSRLGRRSRRRELPLDRARLYVARGVPTRELALWYEGRAGQVERLVGIRPLPLLDERGLAAARLVDELAARLAAAVAGHGHGAVAAFELGRGQHRVLVVEHAERLVVHARPLFRERPRRVFEVCRDGSLVTVERGGDRRASFASRFGVTAAGDRVCFTGLDHEEVASLYLPWIAPEDRAELARRFGELAFPTPPEVSRDEDAVAVQPARRWRIPRASDGLGGWRPGLAGLVRR